MSSSGAYMNHVNQASNDIMVTTKATKRNRHISLDMLYAFIHAWVLGNYSSSSLNPLRPEDNDCSFIDDSNTFPWIEVLFSIRFSQFIIVLFVILSWLHPTDTAGCNYLLIPVPDAWFWRSYESSKSGEQWYYGHNQGSQKKPAYFIGVISSWYAICVYSCVSSVELIIILP